MFSSVFALWKLFNVSLLFICWLAFYRTCATITMFDIWFVFLGISHLGNVLYTWLLFLIIFVLHLFLSQTTPFNHVPYREKSQWASEALKKSIKFFYCRSGPLCLFTGPLRVPVRQVHMRACCVCVQGLGSLANYIPHPRWGFPVSQVLKLLIVSSCPTLTSRSQY